LTTEERVKPKAGKQKPAGRAPAALSFEDLEKLKWPERGPAMIQKPAKSGFSEVVCL
jgi:hypothetical protein